MVVLGWWGGVGAGASHTSLFGVPFSVSLVFIYVDTVSYVVAATSEPGAHLVGVGAGTGLTACLWGQPEKLNTHLIRAQTTVINISYDPQMSAVQEVML